MTDSSPPLPTPRPPVDRVRFWWNFARAFAWGLGVTLGVAVVALVLSYLVLALIAASRDEPLLECSPGALVGTGACDGLPGALQGNALPA